VDLDIIAEETSEAIKMFNTKMIIATIIIAGSLSLVTAPSYGDTITVWGEYHPPLNGNPTDINPGFMIEIAESIFKKHGHDINYILGPRARGVRMAQEGKINCVVNAKIKEHNFLEFPSEPWGYHAATLFSLPSSEFQYQGIKALKKVRLGATAAMRYDNGVMDEYIKSDSKNVSFSYGKNAIERQVRMLLKNRVDTIVSCPLIMRGQLSAMGLETKSLKIVGEVKPYVGMYFACSRRGEKNLRYIALINQEITKMRENGELKKILDKYGQIDWFDLYKKLNSLKHD